MSKNNVPLDWQAKHSDFRIPPRTKNVLKITKPLGEEFSNWQQPRPESSRKLRSSGQEHNKKANGNLKVQGLSDIRTSDAEEVSKNVPIGTLGSGSSKPPGESSIRPTGQLPLNGVAYVRNTETSKVQHGTQKLRVKLESDATEQKDKQQWRPDIFVQAFLPKSLTAINDCPAYLKETPAVRRIDYDHYTRTFAVSSFLPASLKPSYPCLSGEMPVDCLDSMSPENYGRYFGDCLFLDLGSQVSALRSYDLFKVPLEVNRSGHGFRLKVPGLKEEAPSVSLGDFVMLRQLILDPVTQLPRGMDVWLAPGGGRGRGEPAPGFTQIQIRAVVMGIDKANEALILDANGIIGITPGIPVCNASFVVQPSLVESLQRAVEDISGELLKSFDTAKPSKTLPALSNKPSQANWLHSVLFPVEGNGIQQTVLPSVAFQQNWFDTSLNYEQKKAVDAIQSQNYGIFGYLINGPPGTGKTKTISETVTQLGHDKNFLGSILLCAPSNPAADTLALRLRAHFDPKAMLRLNAFSRTFAEVPQELLPYCCVEGDHFSIPAFPKMMSYKIVITTCLDAYMLVLARVTNRDLVALQKNMFAAIHPERNENVFHTATSLHWAAVIVDEAAQATEPETLIPLTVVAPHTAYAYDPVPIFVMAGDQHQLSPRTYHKSTTLNVSLFERLLNNPVYASHPLARKNLRRANQASPMLRPPFVHLIRNYRSHPAILAVPSSLFYENTLIPEASRTDTLQSWTGWRGRRWPVLFACNGGVDDCEDIRSVGGGWYNLREALKAIAFVRHLLDEKIITEQSEICVISPFRAQVHLLRKIARDSHLWGVNIGPLEAFQGLESRFVIICTTRARTRFLEEDQIRGLGIVNEKKKFNVALTRAKEGLIVLGNPWVLATDPYWLAFLEFCHRNSLWAEDEEQEHARMQGLEEANVNNWKPAQVPSDHENGNSLQISGLEAALVYKERDKGAGSRAVRRFMSGSESLEDILWRTGLEAEESLGLTEE